MPIRLLEPRTIAGYRYGEGTILDLQDNKEEEYLVDRAVAEWYTVDGDDALVKANNLADLPDKAAARSNLGLGALATQDFIEGNVKRFGATGDGIADDTAAIQLALDSIPSGKLYFPAGTYLLSAQLIHSGKPINIEGDGQAATNLLWATDDASARGFSFTQTDDRHVIRVSSLTLSTSQTTPSATAISIATPYATNRGLIRAEIASVNFKGTVGASVDGWLGGISLTDMSQVVIRDCAFLGKFETTQNNVKSAFFVKLRNANINPAHIWIQSNLSFYTDKTVDSSNIEGVYIQGNNFVLVNYGVYVSNSAGLKPHLQCTDNHINAYTDCVYVNSSAQSNISQNTLYYRSDFADAKGIHAVDLYTSVIIGNVFNRVNTGTTTTAIYMEGANSQYTIIDNNMIQNATNGIVLDANTRFVSVGASNTFAAGTTFITDNGTGNYRFQFKYNSLEYQGIKVLGGRDTGWGATMTGSADKTTVRDVATVTTPQLAARFKALEDALRTHGLIGS
jgi:hypothetical protein